MMSNYLKNVKKIRSYKQYHKSSATTEEFYSDFHRNFKKANVKMGMSYEFVNDVENGNDLILKQEKVFSEATYFNVNMSY